MADAVLRTGMTKRLRAVTNALVKHIYAVSPQKYWVQSIVLHFAFDSVGQLWLLYCSELKCDIPMETDHKAKQRRALALSKPPGVFSMADHAATHRAQVRSRRGAPSRRCVARHSNGGMLPQVCVGAATHSEALACGGRGFISSKVSPSISLGGSTCALSID